MAHVVDIEVFERLEARFTQLENELTFQRELLNALIWLTKEQTLAILKMHPTTLWRLVKRNEIAYQKEGTRIMFHIDDVRNYLKAKKIPDRCAKERIQQVVT